MPAGFDKGLLPEAATRATPVLKTQQVLDRMRSAVHPTATDHFGAFFSSELGGIVTNPAFMLMHMDDHLVHRGHAVFDTALITEGELYQLPQHLARFKQSAFLAGIKMPMSDPAIMQVILDTAAASKKKNGEMLVQCCIEPNACTHMHTGWDAHKERGGGHVKQAFSTPACAPMHHPMHPPPPSPNAGIVKYWVSPGRGGFGLSSDECIEGTFYVMATSENTRPSENAAKGLSACASPVSPKPGAFGRLKSTNYLPNALAKAQAEAQGIDVVREESVCMYGERVRRGAADVQSL